MAKYRVRAPDGKLLIIEGPAGASEADVMRQAQTLYKPGQRAPSPKSATGVGFVDRANNKRIADYDAGRERSQAARAAPAALGSRVGGDLWEPVGNALSAIGQGYQQFTNTPVGNPFTREGQAAVSQRNAGTNKALGGVVQLAMSPVTVPTNALFGALGRGAEQVGIGNETDNKNALFLASSAMRPGPRPMGPPAPRAAPAARVQVSPAAKTLARRGRVDPAATRAQVADMRAAGVEPNLVAAAGEPAQRLVRAVGAKNAAAGETLTRRARQTVTSTKPAISNRARSTVTDQRTADQYVDDLVKARDEAATTNYAEPYSLEINITPETARALSGPSGEAAIDRAIQAAATRMDTDLVGELRRLKAATRMDTLPGQTKQTGYNTMTAAEPPLAPVSGAALDRVQIALRKTAEGLDRTDQGDIASGLWKRRAQINNDLDNFEGLSEARADFRNKSQAIDVFGPKGKDFLTTDPTDYAAWLETLSPEARAANQVRVRQQIVDKLGKERPGNMGTVEQLGYSEYAPQNLQAALGPEGERFTANLRARMEQLRADQVVSPGAGSRTAVLGEDMEQLENWGKAAEVGVNAVSGRWVNAARGVMDWWRARGIPDDVAQQITQMASDPAQVDGVLSQIEAAMGPGAAREFMALIRQPDVAAPALQLSGANQAR